jgi:uncharacterized membrane protein
MSDIQCHTELDLTAARLVHFDGGYQSVQSVLVSHGQIMMRLTGYSATKYGQLDYEYNLKIVEYQGEEMRV